MPTEISGAVLLTSYEWEARYPGLSEPVTIEEYHEALRQAEVVVACENTNRDGLKLFKKLSFESLCC